MSSQNEGIALHHAPDNVGYRLIELPFELQSLLESQEAPVCTIENSESSAVLKTPQRSYNLRQKNTSNALILLAPHTTDSSSSSAGKPGMAAISTIQETVELEVVHEPPPRVGGLPHTGSKGKWHEKFGRNR